LTRMQSARRRSSIIARPDNSSIIPISVSGLEVKGGDLAREWTKLVICKLRVRRTSFVILKVDLSRVVPAPNSSIAPCDPVSGPVVYPRSRARARARDLEEFPRNQ